MSNAFTAQDFSRVDESEDNNFYVQPRLVVHIDDAAIAAVTNVFRQHIPAGARILDLMSSYRSHLPSDVSYQEVVGLGMNAPELQANSQLGSYVIHNLNRKPELPFEPESFDAVVCSVSVQYITQPIAVFRDVARVLKPDGIFIITFSNRMFPTKAVRIWREGDDEAHIALVKRYFALSQAYKQVEVERYEDKSASWFRPGHDPLFAVLGRRIK